MKLAFADYLILSLYFGFVLGIGWLKKRVSTSEDFLTSGRCVPVFPTALSLSDGVGEKPTRAVAPTGTRASTLRPPRPATTNSGWPGGIYLDEGSGFIGIADNIVYNVGERSDRVRPSVATNYNNTRQNRMATCKESGTSSKIRPGMPGFPREAAGRAGLAPAYRDLLK